MSSPNTSSSWTESTNVLREHISKRLNPFVMETGSTVLFTGPTQIADAVFEKYYAGYVKIAMAGDCEIRVGNSPSGVDARVREMCLDAGYEKVHVYVPSEHPDVKTFCISSFERPIQKITGGFKARDRAMAKGVDYVIARVSQYAGAASGTAANVLSVVFDLRSEQLDGYHIVEALRSCSMPYSSDTSDYVRAQESRD